MSITAREIMTRNVIVGRPDDPVRAIAQLLADHEISAVPVRDDAGMLVGIVSEGDLMRPFSQASLLKRAWWLALLAEGQDLAPNFIDYIGQDGHRARDLMTTPVISASETATVSEMADLMIEHKIKRLPILRGRQLVGIVSRSDIVRTLARAPAKVAAD
jgi:CBS domain-containing protein